ncbi:xanthine phosphoribosyltransferase [Lactobacillus helveticus]|uniref:xanthine phosphoribosyltransferase n=1 Tax=Lactobacillus helveticus TaxID=1587 RepID=UPI0015624849|nr:xanthine phosphoribosyltransferase [Lactobacillus helveticus]MCT0164457.1 xanthine phosphoribosyltransferase [Lactobacillus helveticus]MCT0192723.1 xanthine phosphoribosyltransferase [Lactobacillus helveticus]MCT0198031.1 xanthine phosphoribosyltransferase [Lactobacillus helveticus]NRN72345.1 Xanthine phosphoribosyltransferase [Lactobacillus helveticus]NRN74969.1 Xanthine phosphoribosyltransferase [Lactobacillus helveticus]
MKLLEDRIKKDGEVLDGDVLKINSFLNHQVDPQLVMQCGEEFKRLFADQKIDKVLTCEASGIVPGVMTAYVLGVPMVFARKKKPSTLNDAVYWADVFSYTKKVNNKICVEEKFLHKGENLLIIDDFVAHGEAVKGMVNIAKQAECNIVGVGAIVAKTFQGGSEWVENEGLRFEALAKIDSFKDGHVHFEGEE